MNFTIRRAKEISQSTIGYGQRRVLKKLTKKRYDSQIIGSYIRFKDSDMILVDGINNKLTFVNHVSNFYGKLEGRLMQ